MNVPSLQEALLSADLVEFRQRQGRRYELNAILLLGCVAMMRGAGTEQQIADWIERDGQRWLKWLGVRGERGPGAATVARVFRGTENARLQAALILWAQQVIETLRPARLRQWELSVVSRIETRAWLSGLSGTQAIADISQCLNSIIETLTVSFNHCDEAGRYDAHRYESLLAGLAITGCVESNDLLQHHNNLNLPVYTDCLTPSGKEDEGGGEPAQPKFNRRDNGGIDRARISIN